MIVLRQYTDLWNLLTLRKNKLVEIVSEVANKNINIEHIDGPLGVRGRNSNNDLIREQLNWDYQYSLKDGISVTYEWIDEQVQNKVKSE